MYTQGLNTLSKNDTAIAGGKASSLGEMINAGLPVPNGFVVTTDTFEEFLKEKDLLQEIRSELNDVDRDVIHTGEKASRNIQQLILKQEIPENIKQELTDSFSKLDAEYVAIRSSATSEDGKENAWAGQLDSYLNVTKSNLIESVQKCWASLFTPRAIAYRFEKGLQDSHVSVAVVVQEMIQSEKSGVAFSVHPVTEDINQIIIEAGFGLGEAIVSGQITPDSYVISKKDNDIIDINVNEQSQALYRNESGGNIWKDLGETGKEQVLSSDSILELSEIIKKIEDHYKSPQDIEWALEKNKFYITQSRPITTLG
jgi:pyruvate,water dikinase